MRLSFLTHGSSVGRFGSHCNRAVAMENQHALREDTAVKRNACAVDFGDPKEKTTEWKWRSLLGILAYNKCHANHSSSPRLELFHLTHSRYFVKLEPTRGAYDPMDSRLLRSIASTAARRLTCQSWVSVSECSRKSNSWNKPKGEGHWKTYQGLCQLMIRTVQTEGWQGLHVALGIQ